MYRGRTNKGHKHRSPNLGQLRERESTINQRKTQRHKASKYIRSCVWVYALDGSHRWTPSHVTHIPGISWVIKSSLARLFPYQFLEPQEFFRDQYVLSISSTSAIERNRSGSSALTEFKAFLSNLLSLRKSRFSSATPGMPPPPSRGGISLWSWTPELTRPAGVRRSAYSHLLIAGDLEKSHLLL